MPINYQEELEYAPDAKGERRFGSHTNYTISEAIAEFIDNGIDANATEIYIKFVIDTSNKKVHKLIITDNGDGMNLKELKKSRKIFYSDKNKSIGKYGMGGKTAAYKLGDELTVLTKKENDKIYVRKHRWIDEQNDNTFIPTEIGEASQSYQSSYEKYLPNKSKGTVIIIGCLKSCAKLHIDILKQKLKKFLEQTYRTKIIDDKFNQIDFYID